MMFVYFSSQLLLFLSIFSNNMDNSSSLSSEKLLSVEFEVYGRVQGVFFRKYTQKQATSLGLKGWCMNTEKGTVQGVLEGKAAKVGNMKSWLQTVGSPQSKISRAVFENEKEIKSCTYDSFQIKR